jgi:hypothetical protein
VALAAGGLDSGSLNRIDFTVRLLTYE